MEKKQLVIARTEKMDAEFQWYKRCDSEFCIRQHNTSFGEFCLGTQQQEFLPWHNFINMKTDQKDRQKGKVHKRNAMYM